jgi:hypothetical protein
VDDVPPVAVVAPPTLLPAGLLLSLLQLVRRATAESAATPRYASCLISFAFCLVRKSPCCLAWIGDSSLVSGCPKITSYARCLCCVATGMLGSQRRSTTQCPRRGGSLVPKQNEITETTCSGAAKSLMFECAASLPNSFDIDVAKNILGQWPMRYERSLGCCCCPILVESDPIFADVCLDS